MWRGRASALYNERTSPRSGPLYLKSIDIAGFKSFARPTHLELSAGITALVGPNGSGKSNVVDAIRWCLGEQSARDLRGARAEDVIHAGPRRVLGAAEVMLAFESSSGQDDPFADAAVARRLYRSGESEYLANNCRVRLRDVQDVLRSMGLVESRSVVVTQGMADGLLAATPAERRAVLEQAAGLAGYRVRRDEARQKLATSAQNIETIEVVLTELEPRLRSLRRQARAVRDREEARSKLQAALLAHYAAQWQSVNEQIERLQAEHDAVCREQEERAAALAELEAQRERRLEAERTFNERLARLADAAHEAQREHDHQLFAVRRARELYRAAVGTQEALTDRIDRLQAEREDAIARLAACESEQQQARAAAQEREREVATRAEVRAAGAAGVQRCRAALDDAGKSRREAESILAGLERALAAARVEQHDHEERRAAIECRLTELVAGLAGTEEALQECRRRLLAAEAAEREARERLGAVEAELEANGRRRDRLERLSRQLRDHAGDVRRRMAAAERTRAGFNPTMDRGLLGTVEVRPGWEAAIAAALGPWATSGSPRPLSSQDRDTFLAWRARLPLPVGEWADGGVHGIPDDVVYPLLATLIVTDGEAAGRVWECVGGERPLRLDAPPLLVVTLAGEVLSAYGQEPPRADDSAARYLAVRAELVSLEQAAKRRVRWEEWAGRRLTHVLGAVKASQAQQAEGQRVVRDAAAEAGEARADLHDLERRRRRADEDRRQWHEQCRQWQREAAAAAGRAAELEVRTAEQGAACDSLTKAEEAARADHQREREQLDRFTAEWEERGSELVAVRSRVQSLEAAGATARRDRDRAAAELGSLTAERERVRGEMRVREDETHTGTVRLQELAALLAGHQEALAALQAERPAVTPAASLDGERRAVSMLVGRGERLAATLEAAFTARDRLGEEMGRELEMAPDALPAPGGEEPPGEDELRRLRARANQYADADESVVQECEELEERYRGLRDHLNDLVRASDQLRDIMVTADREMAARFRTAFAAVNEEFGRVFEVMLRGGSASLVQSEEDGGVHIQAQLPGRRQRSSAAFSGGERALVASSLLFGMLRMRPTPFCVLDEVDAALDEGNVDRYLAALRDVAQRTQIIVVTHNRATMAAADTLYGLTMDDEGVSSTLSLRLDAFQPAS